MCNFDILSMKHLGKEENGFHLFRPAGSGDTVFVHFLTSVSITLKGLTFETKPNACIFYSPGCCHDFTVRKGTLVHNWIHFIPSTPLIFERMGIQPDVIFYPLVCSQITDLVKTMEIEFINKKPYWDIKSSALLQWLVAILAQDNFNLNMNANKVTFEYQKQFESLRLQIYNNPKHWSIDSMARQIGLCRSRFSALYTAFFNVPPGEDINRASMERAKNLLSMTDMKIYNIASDIGYKSVEYFDRWFKIKTGRKPSEYRKLNK